MNAYDQITERIVTALEKGVIPWRKPWANVNAGPARNLSGHVYSGINWFLLTGAPYTDPRFLTFKQCSELGGMVRKGEKGWPVVFWKRLGIQDQATGEEKEIPFMRLYWVFNVEQCAGLDVPELPGMPANEWSPIERAQLILDTMSPKPVLHEGGQRAFYAPDADSITMPPRTLFPKAEAYYATLFHEMGHWTGHKSRLARDLSGAFGSAPYAREELVAEMTSAFLCSDCGIGNAVEENTVAYVQNWLAALKKDSKLVVVAAGAAQKAANFIRQGGAAAPVVTLARANQSKPMPASMQLSLF